MNLNLALITHGPGGIRRVASQNLPQVPGVSYIVSWQNHENTPVPDSLAHRPDIFIHRFDTTGQSLNRNNSLELCTADIILIADDDLKYTTEALLNVISTFEEHPEVDLATFRSINDCKTAYPRESVKLKSHLPSNYSVSTYEMAIRRKTAGALRFHPELGLASPSLHGGEDEAFLLTAIKRGLHCRFFPLTLCVHDHPSTGSKAHPTDANIRAAGCIIALYNPWTAVLRLPLKALRLHRSKRANFFRALPLLISGALRTPRLFRRGKKYLW